MLQILKMYMKLLRRLIIKGYIILIDLKIRIYMMFLQWVVALKDFMYINRRDLSVNILSGIIAGIISGVIVGLILWKVTAT